MALGGDGAHLTMRIGLLALVEPATPQHQQGQPRQQHRTRPESECGQLPAVGPGLGQLVGRRRLGRRLHRGGRRRVRRLRLRGHAGRVRRLRLRGHAGRVGRLRLRLRGDHGGLRRLGGRLRRHAGRVRRRVRRLRVRRGAGLVGEGVVPNSSTIRHGVATPVDRQRHDGVNVERAEPHLDRQAVGRLGGEHRVQAVVGHVHGGRHDGSRLRVALVVRGEQAARHLNTVVVQPASLHVGRRVRDDGHHVGHAVRQDHVLGLLLALHARRNGLLPGVLREAYRPRHLGVRRHHHRLDRSIGIGVGELGVAGGLVVRQLNLVGEGERDSTAGLLNLPCRVVVDHHDGRRHVAGGGRIRRLLGQCVIDGVGHRCRGRAVSEQVSVVGCCRAGVRTDAQVGVTIPVSVLDEELHRAGAGAGRLVLDLNGRRSVRLGRRGRRRTARHLTGPVVVRTTDLRPDDLVVRPSRPLGVVGIDERLGAAPRSVVVVEVERHLLVVTRGQVDDADVGIVGLPCRDVAGVRDRQRRAGRGRVGPVPVERRRGDGRVVRHRGRAGRDVGLRLTGVVGQHERTVVPVREPARDRAVPRVVADGVDRHRDRVVTRLEPLVGTGGADVLADEDLLGGLVLLVRLGRLRRDRPRRLRGVRRGRDVAVALATRAIAGHGCRGTAQGKCTSQADAQDGEARPLDAPHGAL